MYDSVNPAAIPQTAYRVAMYGTGFAQVAESSPLWHHWPRTYAIDATGARPEFCSVADIEFGDLSPDDFAGWAAERWKAHPNGVLLRPYIERSRWAELRAVVGRMPADQRAAVRYWIADWTMTPHSLPGASAVQWGPFGAYDLSHVETSWDQ